MTQISDLKIEFVTAVNMIKSRLDTSLSSEAEQKLSQELELSKSQIAELEKSLELQQENYLSLSQEYGDLDLNFEKFKQDDSAKYEKEQLEEQLKTLSSETDNKIADLTDASEQIAAENAKLSAELTELKAEKSALESSVASLKADATNLQSSLQSSQQSSNDDLDALRTQHDTDIQNVENILKLLKPLVEE